MNLTGLLHLKSDELQKNILSSTYFSLRIGIVVLSVGLPLILYFGGVWWGQIGQLAHSMSVYYGEGGPRRRSWVWSVVRDTLVVGSFPVPAAPRLPVAREPG